MKKKKLYEDGGAVIGICIHKNPLTHNVTGHAYLLIEKTQQSFAQRELIFADLINLDNSLKIRLHRTSPTEVLQITNNFKKHVLDKLAPISRLAYQTLIDRLRIDKNCEQLLDFSTWGLDLMRDQGVLNCYKFIHDALTEAHIKMADHYYIPYSKH